eukprot:gene8239-64_t
MFSCPYKFTQVFLVIVVLVIGTGGIYAETTKTASVTCFGFDSTDPSACSGNGNCTATNKCQCKSGYSGNQCQTYSCYGTSSTNRKVCSGRGECVSIDQCHCFNETIGYECEIPKCFGVYSNDTTVCSSHGTCEDTNTCNCPHGYSGSNCEATICYGRNSSDKQVCSSRGKCISPNTCSCDAGYSGTSCQLDSYKCYGSSPGDPKACSGNGICSSANNCTCNTGFVGSRCSNFQCFGVDSKNGRVCSRFGTCVGPNNCSCDEGFSGENCDLPICFGLNASDPLVCSGHGACSGLDRCLCETGFNGERCEQNNTVAFNGATDCMIVGNNFLRYYRTGKTYVIEPSICSARGWAGISFHQKEGIETSMFMAVSWYTDADNLKISEMKNHLAPTISESTESIGLLLPRDKNFPDVQFADKQRFTIRVDDLLLQNFDYISIVCSDIPPNENLTFPYHRSVITKRFNISSDRYVCDSYVLSGFATRLSDVSQPFWFLELGVYIGILFLVVIHRNSQPLKSQNVSENGKSKSLYFRFVLITKWITKPSISFFIIAVFWFISTFIDLFIYAAFSPQFQCTTEKSFTVYALHFVYNLICGIILISVGIIDILSNVMFYFKRVQKQNYRRCFALKVLKEQIIDFFYKSDPYYFRFEQIIAFNVFLMYVFFEGFNLNVPIFGKETAFYFYFGKYFAAIGRSFVAYLFAFYQALLPLIITMIVNLIHYIQALKKEEETRDGYEIEKYLDHDELFDLFLEFAKDEWSQENVLAYRDIKKFKRLNSLDKRKNHAQKIYYNYFNGAQSPLEVNIDAKACKDLFRNLNEKDSKYNEEIFEDIEQTVKTNIRDTWSRFVLTSKFLNYKQNSFLQRQELDNM